MQSGNEVAGFDKIRNAATSNLERLGVIIFTEDEVKLDDFDVVFRSAALKDDHKIIAEAIKKGIPVISRYELFEELSKTRDIVAIAGSSGKTSTTGITSHILSGDRDCGYLVGIHGNGGHYGTAPEFILEADEYAKTFLHLKKIKIGIITGLKYDHVDIYPTKKEYDDAFMLFASRVEKLIINGDDEYLFNMMKDLNPITFGKGAINEWQARNIKNYEGGSSFDVYKLEHKVASITLNVIGGHNIINALAGFVTNYYLNVQVKKIVARLSYFRGLPRRVELLSKAPYYIYDDYAHLPFEIETVLKGLKESFPNRKILCVFQGHTYTRINAFFDDYAKALSNCDELFLMDVYAARDSEGSVDLEKLISQVHSKVKHLSGGLKETHEMVKNSIQDANVIIYLNAGDATKIAHELAGG